MAGFKGVRASGTGIEIRWQIDGQRYSRFINKTPNPTNLSDAARLRKSFIEQTSLGELDNSNPDNPTFEESCKAFLAYKKKTLKTSTLEKYRYKLEQFWSPLANYHTRSITVARLRQIDQEIQWTSATTRNHAVDVLRGVFSHAFDTDIITTNPALKLKKGKKEQRLIDAFTPDEKTKILSSLSGKYRLFYTLQFETGARTGELIGLKWSDVKGDKIQINRSLYRGEVTTTKTHQAREVLLTEKAKTALNDFTESRFTGGYVFTTYTGKPFKKEAHLAKEFRKACKASEVRYRRPYNCRHSYASHAITNGVTIAFIARQMGDRVDTVLRNYAQWIDGLNDKKELEKMNSGDKVGIVPRETTLTD